MDLVVVCVWSQSTITRAHVLNRTLSCKDECSEVLHVIKICEGEPLIERSRIFENVYSDVEICKGSNPIIRESVIYGGRMSGLFVYQGGHGTIEDCEIFGHANYEELVIKEESNPMLERCKIHDGKVGGVLFLEHAAGTLKHCEIYKNGYSGVWIRTGSHPTIQNTKINDNDGVAVRVDQDSTGNIVDCDLRGNSQGPWNLPVGSQLSQSGNKE